MHRCEFCDATFQARRQVKRPRACLSCQPRRQRENEKTWRINNKAQYDNQYHRIQKLRRIKKLGQMSEELHRFMDVGQKFLQTDLKLEHLQEFLFQFLSEIGVRQINKLWPILIA